MHIMHNIQQNKNAAPASLFFCTFLCLCCTTTTGKCLISLFKVMLLGIRTIRNDDFQRDTHSVGTTCNHSKQCRSNIAPLHCAKNRFDGLCLYTLVITLYIHNLVSIVTRSMLRQNLQFATMTFRHWRITTLLWPLRFYLRYSDLEQFSFSFLTRELNNVLHVQ